VSTSSLPTIWELLADAARTLPEPFSRASLINWVRARRPDVAVPSISAHIQQATDNAGATPTGGRTPLLHRLDRGLYCRYRPVGVRGPAEVPTRRVVLIGSSGAMGDAPGPAGDLFSSAGFARAREHAERLGYPWFVLSAKHGLLEPGDVVGPFDLQFGDQPVGYRTAWGEWVAAQLADRLRLQDVVVEVHGGVDFAQPLRKPLARRGAALELPLPIQWRDQPQMPEPREPETGVPAEPAENAARAALGRLRHLMGTHRPPEPRSSGSDGGSSPHASAS
jgi:hypothetical protein